jgi:hypothetical protein
MIWWLAFLSMTGGVAAILFLAQRRSARPGVELSLLQTVKSEPEMQLAVQRLASFGIGVKVKPIGHIPSAGLIRLGPIPPYANEYQMWVAVHDEQAAREVLGI